MPLSRPIHPYLEIWMNCRKYAGPLGGTALPETGGWLDQDAELMLAFDILNQLYAELEEEKKRREELAEEVKRRAASMNAPAAT